MKAAVGISFTSVGHTMRESSEQTLAARFGIRVTWKGRGMFAFELDEESSRAAEGRGSRDMVSNLRCHGFSSLCVCIYKYICVFIFSIGHTHIISTRYCACV